MTLENCLRAIVRSKPGVNEASRPIAVRTLLYILLSFSQNQNKKVWHFCLIFIGNFLEKHSIT